METNYRHQEPSREEIDNLAGASLLEFGTAWCGYCLAIQGVLASALARHPALTHIKVEDGPGRPLGRSFRVTLWPTLVFLRDGQEVARLVRPNSSRAIEEALSKIAA
jgi:thioredoxin 1